jgi:hypothetical protein
MDFERMGSDAFPMMVLALTDGAPSLIPFSD